jgi:hypothetical protein
MFPGCVILKNDSSYLQGVPDLIILWGPYWAMLEVKTHANANQQQNQEYYIDVLNEMSFAAFIHPDNEEEVFDALQHAFQPERNSRVPQR